ncbi:hypothetical protein [Qipengyuania atrilutea]|uniref:Uncharacterized protein n=1 Tax=Qipengyuania atrilutea TaxID=2744473 RepID=A0A850HD32_9SPHN|nr:hypothetical protein [Actirhodobacter atriluteus]NVD45039.1 hypothetical protein [Actirhodobacter atriluteus]
MLSIYDDATAAAALSQPLNPQLKDLIEARLSDARKLGLSEQTHIVVIQPQDSEAALVTELGWSPLVHPIDGTRYGAADFEPYWAWLEDVGGCYELLHPVGNAGFAYILLIEKGASKFAAMCQEALQAGSDSCDF